MNLRSRSIFWLILLCTLCLSACVAHAPMSDSIMFNTLDRKEIEPKKLYKAQAMQTDLGPFFRIEARRYFKNTNDRIARDWFVYNNMGASHSISRIKKIKNDHNAISFNLGPAALGIDFTKRIHPKNYLTVAYSYPLHFQAYHQVKLIENRNRGLALGWGYQRINFPFEGYKPCEDDPCGWYNWPQKVYDSIDTFGIRAYHLKKNYDESSDLRFGLYVGYAPELKRQIIQFSISSIGF